MIATLDQRDSFVSAAEYLIAKYGPVMMRAGGGAISNEGRSAQSKAVTDDEIRRIQQLAAEGKSALEIATETRRSKCVVYRWIRETVPVRRGRPIRMTPIKAKVLSLIGTSKNQAEVARRAGTTRAYVRQIIEANAMGAI